MNNEIAVFFCRAGLNPAAPLWRRALTRLACWWEGTDRIHVALGSHWDYAVLDLRPDGDRVWDWRDFVLNNQDASIQVVSGYVPFRPARCQWEKTPNWPVDLFRIVVHRLTEGRYYRDSPDCVHQACCLLRMHGVMVPRDIVTAKQLEGWLRGYRIFAGKDTPTDKAPRRDDARAHAAAGRAAAVA